MAAVETASNVGTGAGVFKQKTGTDLELRSLTGIQGLEAVVAGDEITIGYVAGVTAASDQITADDTTLDASNSQMIPEANTASNLGGGIGVFKDKQNIDLRFKSLTGGGPIQVVDTGDEISIGYQNIVTAASTSVTADSTDLDASNVAEIPETNDGRNLGSGVGVFKDKDGVFLQFKSLAAGSNVTLTDAADTITIDASDDATTASNTGAGAGVFKQKTGDDLELRSLVGGANVTVTESADSITIDASDPVTASNVGGTGLFKQKVGSDLQFKGLTAGTNINLTAGTDTVTIEATGGSSNSPWFNVLDYGAKNDDTDPNATTAAFQSAINAIQAQPGSLSGVLYIPAGTYNLNARLVSTGKPITIQGDGFGVTILKWSQNPAGILINDVQTQSSIKSLSFVTTIANGGTALEILGVYLSGPVRTGVAISNVSMTGDHGAMGYWTKGIVLSEAPQSFIENFQFDGRAAGIGAPGIGSQYGLEINTNNKATQYKLIGSNFFRCKSAVKITGDADTAEGLEITSSDFVANEIGLDAFDMLGQDTVGFLITNCHFANIIYNILGAITQTTIIGNLFYDREESTVSSAMLLIRDDSDTPATSQSIVISNNIFVNSKATAMQGIVLSHKALNAVVSGNSFQMGNSGASAIIFEGPDPSDPANKPGALNCFATNNTFYGDVNPYTYDKNVNAVGVRGAMVGINGDIGLTLLAAKTLSWDISNFNSHGFYNPASPTLLTIPGGAGFRRVRVSAQLQYDGAGVGYVRLNIRKNGSGQYPGRGAAYTFKNTTAGVPINCVTGIVEVSPGDSFSVQAVSEASGNRISGDNGNKCFFMLEVID